MKLAPLLHKIDALQQAIDAKGPLDETIKKRIQYKFRLDWNYYSNAMEGNSLTKQETRSVMMNNITINGKPMRDVLEIKGHDEAVLDILKISKAEVRLSERRIKELHKAIIYEEDPEKAQQVGEWKTQANYLLNVRNERFDFLEPELVPDAMHQLLDKTNAQIDAYYHATKEGWHPAVIAFYFHLEYVKIHPFYDGNGRTARLLMNLLLVSFGLPPVVLNLENKERYYSLLTDIQGYGGNPDLFYAFMSELLIESQEMVLDAIDGKDISGEDDLDKEIELFKKQLVKNDKLVSRNNPDIAKLYKSSIEPLFRSLLDKLSRFDDLFDKKAVSNAFDFKNSITMFDDLEDFTEFFDKIIYLSNLSDKVNTGEHTQEEYTELMMLELDKVKEVYSIALNVSYVGFKNNDTNTFGARCELSIFFNDYSFKINSHGQNHDEGNFVKKLYTEVLTKEEIDTIVKTCVSDFLNRIRSSIKND